MLTPLFKGLPGRFNVFFRDLLLFFYKNPRFPSALSADG
jgi:hypothetical protein